MDERELMKKLEREEPLRIEEALWLDEALERQDHLRGLVGSIADEPPSLAWRSRLNRRLAETVRPAQVCPRWAWAPALALAGAAGALLVARFGATGAAGPVTEGDSSSIEQSLVRAHQEAGLGDGTGPWFPVELEAVPEL
jgi:hypothetical protein